MTSFARVWGKNLIFSLFVMDIVLEAALSENKRRRSGHVSSCRKAVGEINVALVVLV
jgi:hypothetical protein